MKDILDFDDDNLFSDYIFVYEHQIDGVIELLMEHNIPFKVKVPAYTQDTLIVPNTAVTELQRKDFAIQIPLNYQLKVDYLMAENENLMQDSRQIRKLFLINSLDNDGLINILLFPEEWLDMDREIALEILSVKGINIPESEYKQRRSEQEVVRNNKNKKTKPKKIALFAFVLIMILLILLTFGGL
jgi:hypothetical protein